MQAWHDLHGRAGAYVDGITFLTVAVNLMDDTAVSALREFIGERSPVLTMFDTLARCTVGADENAAKDMGRVVEALDATRDASAGHVSAVHHAGKDTTKGMRGSSALLGAVDTVIELSGDGEAIRCQVTDQKDAEPAPPWWCHLQPVGASAVIEEVAGRDVMSKADRMTLEAGKALADEHRTAEVEGASRGGGHLKADLLPPAQ